MKLIDLTGRRFGRLVVESRATNAGTHVRWLCLCDCGARKVIRGKALRYGATSSCGCYRIERVREACAKAVVTYSGAHMRVSQARGPARLHKCVDCGATARDWSYTGGDPNEVCDNSNHGYPARFSVSPDYYVPRCRPCHASHDKDARRAAA